MVNLQMGDIQEGVAPQEFHPDLGFLQFLTDADARGRQILINNVDYQGMPAIEFSFQVIYPEPKTLGNSPAPVARIMIAGSFNSKTDQMNQFTTRYLLDTGAELIFDQVEILTLKKMDPPQEIIDLLESIK